MALLDPRGQFRNAELAVGGGLGVQPAQHAFAARLGNGRQQQPTGGRAGEVILLPAADAERVRSAKGALTAAPAVDLDLQTDHPEDTDGEAGLGAQAVDQAGQATVADQAGLSRAAQEGGSRGGGIGAGMGVFIEQAHLDEAVQQLRCARLGAIEATDDVHHGRLRMFLVEKLEDLDHALGKFGLVRSVHRHVPPCLFL